MMTKRSGSLVLADVGQVNPDHRRSTTPKRAYLSLVDEPLVGRDRETAWLSDRIDGRASNGALIVVSGEAGVGKTQLVRHVLGGRRVIAVAFPRAHLPQPGFGLRRLAELAAPVTDHLAGELSSAAPGGTWKLEAICAAANECLLVQPSPIIVFDDLQWSDELTQAWLSQLAPTLRSAPAVVVGVVRTAGELPPAVLDLVSPLAREHLVEILQVEPLAVDSVREMITLRGLADSPGLAELIHSQTDGIPLAVDAVLGEIAGGRLDVAELAAPAVNTKGGGSLLLAAVVSEHLGDLDPVGQELVLLAAVAPQPPSENVLRRAMACPPAVFDRALDDAIAAGLLTWSSTGLGFRHEFHRESLQSQMRVSQRRALHRRMASILAAQEHPPPAQIAQQLAEAGAAREAVGWFERAADEATSAHDHGNALSQLAAAVQLCAPVDGLLLHPIAGRVDTAARFSGQPLAAAALLDQALAGPRSSLDAGRILRSRARLLSYAGQYDACVETLIAARERCQRAADGPGLAFVLGDLAFPVGGDFTLEERIEFGRAGLAVAEAVGDASAVVHCLVNLASAAFYSGDPEAFDLWERVRRTAPVTPVYVPEETNQLLRAHSNWAMAATATGAYGDAERVIRDGLALCRTPFWKTALHGVATIERWRTGNWDQAVAEAHRALAGHGRPQIQVLVRGIASDIAFERERRPDIAPLVDAATELAKWQDEELGSIAWAMLARARASRREPQPTRGADAIVDLIVASRIQVGWEDLLVGLARVSPRACEAAMDRLGTLRPRGARAEACLAYVAGLVASARRTPGADDLLIAAAERFEALPEPFNAAGALEAAARVRVREARRAGELRRRAAHLYKELGADRSLAVLLREAGTTTALKEFRVPPAQRQAASPGLTKREREVAELARRGFTTAQIAEQLHVAPATAKKHLEKVKVKLGVRRKSELVRALSDLPES